jgi:hypothetical protein
MQMLHKVMMDSKTHWSKRYRVLRAVMATVSGHEILDATTTNKQYALVWRRMKSAGCRPAAMPWIIEGFGPPSNLPAYMLTLSADRERIRKSGWMGAR